METTVYIVMMYLVNLEIFCFTENYCFFHIPDLTVGTIITTTASPNSVECFMLSALCIQNPVRQVLYQFILLRITRPREVNSCIDSASMCQKLDLDPGLPTPKFVHLYQVLQTDNLFFFIITLKAFVLKFLLLFH